MSATLALIAMAVQIQIVTGIGNETINLKAQKGETVVLKCSISVGEATWLAWLGPDVNNAEQGFDVYYLNDDKNPKLNQTKYSLPENEGGYDLIIVNFLEENAGFYICRFEKDGTLHEIMYNVSLLDMLASTTFIYDEEGNIAHYNDTGYATNTTILLEDLSVSHDIRTLIWALSALFIFIMTTTCTVLVSSRVRRYSHTIHIVGPNVHVPSIPIYYSAPESENSRHVYDQPIPQYLEVIESEEQDYLSDSNEDESTDAIIIAVLDQTSHDYEEIQ